MESSSHQLNNWQRNELEFGVNTFKSKQRPETAALQTTTANKL